jgi:(p)ppGpp synthase/HD superfamily hydrolase
LSTNFNDSPGPPLYSPTVEAAVRLAAQGHYHQFRKRDRSTNAPATPGSPLPEDHIPYITHLMGTMTILARFGAPDEVLAAAALHDYLEDVPDPDGRERIREITSDEVLELVLAVTEDKRPGRSRGETWELRKQEQIAEIESMPRDAVLIKGADVLHNLLSLDFDLNEAPDPQLVWGRFNAPKEKQLWYFSSILEAIHQRLGEHRLTSELAEVISRLRD